MGLRGFSQLGGTFNKQTPEARRRARTAKGKTSQPKSNKKRTMKHTHTRRRTTHKAQQAAPRYTHTAQHLIQPYFGFWFAFRSFVFSVFLLCFVCFAAGWRCFLLGVFWPPRVEKPGKQPNSRQPPAPPPPTRTATTTRWESWGAVAGVAEASCDAAWKKPPTVGLEPTTTRLRALRSAD